MALRERAPYLLRIDCELRQLVVLGQKLLNHLRLDLNVGVLDCSMGCSCHFILWRLLVQYALDLAIFKD